ncbi:hypothetical protein O181_016371 [Austropuccinia psidii MF-1]|uniref:Reverse transcriptase zinc-binding domain-containing protein n=1 Tax=Austropuccinia psidii MF-1 TaxID=1389203 RepID=A0A9Q3C1K2_9BASI|nr:hypothetical protein [Austropuccinia psidii MF-1]
MQHQLIPPSKANIKQRITKENIPNDFTPEEKKRLWVRSRPKKFNKALSTQEKAITSAVNQLYSKHIALDSYLHQIGAQGSPICNDCNQIESVRHFLSHCRRYQAQRKRMKTDLRSDHIRFKSEDLRGILDNPRAIMHISRFLSELGRFEHLHLYRK